MALEFINSGRSVAVGQTIFVVYPENDTSSYSAADNTNADHDTRKVWIEFGRKANIPVRCIYFTAPAKLCEHNDTFRALNSGVMNPEKRMILPHSAFTSFASRFREPRAEEGFKEIIPIHFKVRISVRTLGSII